MRGWWLRGVALVAGISWAAPSLLADEELVRQTMQVNALAPYALIRGLFADLERAPKGGRIVVVSSLAGCIPPPGPLRPRSGVTASGGRRRCRAVSHGWPAGGPPRCALSAARFVNSRTS